MGTGHRWLASCSESELAALNASVPPAASAWLLQGLPLRILRPSIVGGASLHHMMPGYIGNAGGEY